MNNLNNLHPMVRYGIAASMVEFEALNTNPEKRADLWKLAKHALSHWVNELILAPNIAQDGISIHYRSLPESQFSNRKNAEKGYFIAPHVLTSNNIADIIKELSKLRDILSKEDGGKTYELKRSFAPMIAKLNAGKKSMSNPKIDTLKAAFTCIAALSPLKPAAFIKTLGDKFSNAGIIPDLPFIDRDTGERPMIEFIKLFKRIISKQGYVKAPTKDKKFPRPDIFYGNYLNRPKTFGIGVVSLIAAIGQWAKEKNEDYNESKQVVELLSKNPIYIVSYIGTNQERFGHHLVDLAMTGTLHLMMQKLPHVHLIGVEDGKKFSDPKWQLFTRSFDHFLRFFDKSSWQNFIYHRATYPFEFFQLLKSYFMKSKEYEGKYSERAINSAISYGKFLNKSAFIAADNQFKDDQKNNRKGRTRNEYKHQFLLQFESIVGSAENGFELISRLNSQAGRFAMREVGNESEEFLRMATNEKIQLEDSKHLITAFMRLSTYNPNQASNDTSADSENALLGADGIPV